MAVATDVRVTFPLKDIRAAFGVAARCVPASSPKPILTSVRLDLEPGFATFSATDLEQGIRHRIPCDYSDDSVSAILPKQLTDAVLRVADSEELKFWFDGPEITIISPSARWNLKTEDASGFPEVPEFDAPTWHTVEAGRLALMIRRTQYAIDLKTTRYALGGTYCEPLLTALSFTGTDGRVVAHQQIEATAKNGLPEVSAAVIPAKAIRVLQGILPNTMDLVDVGFPNANWIHFRIGDTTLSSRLVEGRFPKQWRDAIPTAKPAGKVLINAGLLKSAIARVETHISPDSRRMTLAFEDNTLTLICRASVGEAQATVAIDWDEAAIEVDVTPKNLVDMVKGLGDGAVPEFEIPAGSDPVAVRLEDTFLGLIYTLKQDNQ